MVSACSQPSWVGEWRVSCQNVSAISVDLMGSEWGTYGCPVEGVTDPIEGLCLRSDPLLLIDWICSAK